VLFQENLQSPHVIAVLVGEKDAVELIRLDAEPCEAQAELFGAESGIDHQARPAALDHRRVPSTAAAKHREPNHRASLRAECGSRKRFGRFRRKE
jgi:hypothetical protein